MLGYSQFRWVFKAKTTGFPRGYKPPHIFDSHFDPATGGYRVGTVRDWADGTHIKLQDGWYPYDRQSRAVLVGEDWKDLDDHSAEVSPSEHSKYPRPHNVRKHAVGLFEVGNKLNRADDGKEVPDLDAVLRSLPEKLTTLAENSRRLFDELLDDQSGHTQKYRGRMVEISSGIDLALEMVEAMLENKTLGNAKSAQFAVAKTMNEITDFIGDLYGMAEAAPDSYYDRTVVSDTSDDPKLQALANDKIVSGRLIGSQGCIATTVLAKTESGGHVIVKNDSAAIHAGAAEEAAMYEISKILGIGEIPETLLTEESLLHDNIAAAAEARRKMPQPINAEAKSLTSVQSYKEGPTLQEAYFTPLEDLREPNKQLLEMLALDLITANFDRHRSNMIKGRNGELWGIDGGYAFRTESFSRIGLNHEFVKILESASDEDQSGVIAAKDAVMEKLKQVAANLPKVSESLRRRTRLSDQQIAETVERIDTIAKTGRLIPKAIESGQLRRIFGPPD